MFGNLVVRIAVGVNGAIHLFERHEGMDKLIVCVKKSAEPLLVLNMMNLAKKCQPLAAIGGFAWQART